MKTKHTPGPWTIAESMYGVGNLLVAGVVKDHQPIANCGYDDTGESQANARLIASAPELLEALTFALDMLDHLPDRIGGIGTKYVKERMTTAITKATGDDHD